MDKTEFLNKLRLALNGRVDESIVYENLTYYEDYINSQIRMGQTEEQVLQSLGDPRLIAKTIIGTNGIDNEGAVYRQGNYEYDEDRTENRQGNVIRRYNIPRWLWICIVVLVVFVVLSVIFSILTFLVPFLLPLFIVLFLVKLFRDWLN